MKHKKFQHTGATIVKIGGSLIFDDHGTLKKAKLHSIFNAFSDVIKKNAIYVLGSGKFMHDLTIKYNLNNRYNPDIRMKGLMLINQMTNKRIVDIGKIFDIKVTNPMDILYKSTYGDKTSSEIEWFNYDSLSGSPSAIISGAVLDKNIMFATISSDTMASHIAINTRSQRIILATDVDGVLDNKGRTIKELNINQYARMKFISGGMKDKIRRVKPAVEHGIECYILDGNKAAKYGLQEILNSCTYTKLVG